MQKKNQKKQAHEKLLQDDQGDPSLGRWLVYYGTILSGVLVVSGLLLAIYEVVIQPTIGDGSYHSNVGMPIIMAGVGIYTSGAITKAWSAHAEAKKMAVLDRPISAPEIGDSVDGSATGSEPSDPVNV